MSQRKLIGRKSSIPMTEMNANNGEVFGEVNQGLSVQYEERKRKLTRISMDSDPGDESSKKIDLEDSDAPKSSKAQKLTEAIMTGNIDSVQRLLEQKSVDVNACDGFGRSPLHNAILRGDTRIVELLLQANADLNVKDDREDTPLHFAVRSANQRIVKILLSYPECEVNTKGSSLNSPLHLAASQNRPALCKMLVDRGAHLNSQEENGKTPLGKAVESGAKDSARFLLKQLSDQGMDITEYLNDADYDGTTLLHLAVDSGFLEVVKLCVEYGSIIRQPRRKDRITAFHLACGQGSVNIVEFLVQQDPPIAKILLVDSEGTTPLHYTARNNIYAVAEILIDNGADVNARDIYNTTPLMSAAKTGATETVILLMSKGADPTIRNVDGRTAVFNAVGHSLAMEAILQDPVVAPLLTEKDESGFTVAHYAAKRNDVKSMLLFLKYNKSATSVVSDALDTPLHVAAQYGSHEIVRVMLEKLGTKLVNAQNNRSRTALHLACRGGHYRAAVLLLGHGASVDKDQTGRTPLHEAALNGAKKVVELITENHLHCLNYLDEDKNTALHLAVIHCKPEIIAFLLSINRQELLKNSSNHNILDAAMELDNPDAAMAIAEHPRWREILEGCSTGVNKIFKAMVIKMPKVAERILDNCVESEGDKTSEGYKIKYDLGVLLRKSNVNEKSSMDILQHIADNRCENCLTHQVSFITLCTKWNSFGWIAFFVNIFTVLTYLIPLTVLHSTFEDDDEKYCPDRINYTSSGSIIYLLEVKTCLKNHTGLQVGQIIVAVIIFLLVLKEIVQMFQKKLQWLLSGTNIIEIVAYISAIISIIPTCECKWGYQRQAAAVGLFFGWINLIMYLQGLPFYGKYVIMLYRMFITLLKVLLLFALFAFAFGTTFHQILDQEPFTSLPNILMNMFIMTLGEINYVDVFMPWNKLYYPFLVNLLLIMFCLTMPIILMNMLVGLSVGDIDKIEQSALIDRYVLQVALLNSIENSLPLFILRRLQQKSVTIYPNKRPPIRTMIFDFLIGFGKVEDVESIDQQGDQVVIKVKELQEKMEEQSHMIDEMKAMMKQMFDMMKEIEEEKAAKAKSQMAAKAVAIPSITGLTGSLGSALSFGFGSKKESEDTAA